MIINTNFENEKVHIVLRSTLTTSPVVLLPCSGNPHYSILNHVFQPSLWIRGITEMVLNNIWFSKSCLLIGVFLRVFWKLAASYPRGGYTSVTRGKRVPVCTVSLALKAVWLKRTIEISAIIILMMTMIILHMAALRVNGTVSFVCQHLAGCHTSAEYHLNCAINISPLHSPQGSCLPKCLKKPPSLLKA